MYILHTWKTIKKTFLKTNRISLSFLLNCRTKTGYRRPYNRYQNKDWCDNVQPTTMRHLSAIFSFKKTNWVFVAVSRLSLDFWRTGALLQVRCPVSACSVSPVVERSSRVLAPSLRCLSLVALACGVFPERGWNPGPLHWQVDSHPLDHQGSPAFFLKDLWVLHLLPLITLPPKEAFVFWKLINYLKIKADEKLFYFCPG